MQRRIGMFYIRFYCEFRMSWWKEHQHMNFVLDGVVYILSILQYSTESVGIPWARKPSVCFLNKLSSIKFGLVDSTCIFLIKYSVSYSSYQFSFFCSCQLSCRIFMFQIHTYRRVWKKLFMGSTVSVCVLASVGEQLYFIRSIEIL